MKHIIYLITMFIVTASLAHAELNLGIMKDVNRRIRQLDAKVMQHALLKAAPAPSPSPSITSAPSAASAVGTTFSYAITALNGPTTFNAAGLPAGLAVNSNTGLISGTPAAAGTFNVTLTAANAAGSVTQPLTLVIAGVPGALPAITSAGSASGTAGSAFNYAITATNSPGTFAAAGLPAGLSLNTNTGVISGTPSFAGTASVTLSAFNATGAGTQTLTLTIAAAPVLTPAITSPGTAGGTAGNAFTYTISASNTPTSFAASGLPAGLSVNAQSGLISGTPSAAGTASVTLSASNAGGTGTKTLTLTISAVAAPTGIKTGAYTENNTTIETATEVFENWLNSGSVYAIQYGGDASANDFTGSVPWALGLVPNNRKLLWSQPLVYVGASLASAASGSLDSAYASIAASLAAGAAQGKILLVRIGWEFNGGWYAWSIKTGSSTDYVTAWRKLALAIRAKSPGIKFEWCPNWGEVDPTAAYPGDDVVDYIGMDAYEDTAYMSGSASSRWAQFVNHSGWDLTKMAAFAGAHNKAMGISEYGSNFSDGYFVTQMAAWIKSHNVDHHSYWDSTHPFNGLLANYPLNQAAYYAAWGGLTAQAPALPGPLTASRAADPASGYITAANRPAGFGAAGLPIEE